MEPSIARPEKSEYNLAYEKYVGLVTCSDVVQGLSDQLNGTLQLLDSIDETQSLYRYEPGKWSIKEILGHISDCERIFTYRALRIARGDKTPLPGFEQDDYVNTAKANQRAWESLKEEYESVRRASILFFNSLDADAWLREGIANNNTISVRALVYIVAGHELHHLNVMRSRYLPKSKVPTV